VVDAVSNLSVQTDVVVVHVNWGPLHMGNSSSSVIIGVNVAFAAPAGDTKRFVLVTVREVE
jgi:hypothetical protein